MLSTSKKLKEILARLVWEFDLSTRSHDAMKDHDIETIGDLIQKTENEMLRISGFGPKSLNEVRELLQVMNLSFGMKIENGVLKRPTGEIVSENIE